MKIDVRNIEDYTEENEQFNSKSRVNNKNRNKTRLKDEISNTKMGKVKKQMKVRKPAG